MSRMDAAQPRVAAQVQEGNRVPVLVPGAKAAESDRRNPEEDWLGTTIICSTCLEESCILWLYLSCHKAF